MAAERQSAATRRRGIAWLAVLVGLVGLAWGLVAGLGRHTEVARSYAAPGVARWVAHPEGGVAAYFHYELTLPAKPHNAWVLVQAPEVVRLFVNGHAAYSQRRFSQQIAAPVDITRRLVRGKNVLAVYVEVVSKGMDCQLALIGESRDFAGRVTPIRTGPNWRVSNVAERQRGGRVRWSNPRFDASNWVKVAPRGWTKAGVLPDLERDPAIYQQPLRGDWIWDSRAGVRTIFVRGALQLTQRPRRAYLRVSTRSHYSLTINGELVAEITPPNVGIHVYPVTPFLRPGNNWIALAAESVRTPRGLSLDGMVFLPDGEQIELRTDESWQMVREAPPGWAKGADAVFDRPFVQAHDQFRTEIASPRMVARVALPPRVMAGVVQRVAGAALAGVLAAIALWLMLAAGLAGITRRSWSEALLIEGLAFVGPLLTLGAAVLRSADINQPLQTLYEPFWLKLAFGILLGLQPLIYLESWLRRRLHWRLPVERQRWLRVALSAGAVLVVVGLVSVRAHWQLGRLGEAPLITPEINTMTAAESVLREGVPVLYAPRVRRELVTYEASYYPAALSLAALGKTPLAVRLPSVLFGLATIGLLAWAGWRMFGVSVGLLAAALMTISPWGLLWATRAKYPAQLMFFMLATACLTWLAVAGPRLRPAYLYAAAAAMLVTYLTWQGSLLFVPALLVGVIVLCRGRQRWWREYHAWASVALLAAAISLHLLRRVLITAPHSFLGTGLSTEIGPIFLRPHFAAWPYLTGFLTAEEHVALAVAAALGLVFARRNREFQYLAALVLVTIVMTTLWLYPYTNRYVSGLAPLYLLVGAAGLTSAFRSGARLLARLPAAPQAHWWALGGAAAAGLIWGCWTTVNPVFRFSDPTYISPRSATREVMPWGPDVRALSDYARPRRRPGDAVISVSPVPAAYYFGQCDYFLQTSQQVQVHLVEYEGERAYIHKSMGSTHIRTVAELQEVMRRHEQVWFVAASDRLFRMLCDRPMIDFIEKNFTVVRHSSGSRLYHWSG